MTYTVTTVLFIWDPQKSDKNLKKHRISFELASTVFSDPFHLSVLEGKTGHEERWVTVGLAADQQTLVVVHLYVEARKSETVRIVSARSATKAERKQYEEGL